MEERRAPPVVLGLQTAGEKRAMGSVGTDGGRRREQTNRAVAEGRAWNGGSGWTRGGVHC